MGCGHYQIFIRDNLTLEKVQQISKYQRLEMTRRRNDVGGWVLELDLGCAELKHQYQNERYGIEVWRKGARYFSGPITRISRSLQGNIQTLTLTGTDENGHLLRELCLPDPWRYTTQFNMAYDSRSGAAERVLKNYVDLNIGPNCPDASRRVPNLVIEPTQDRGEQVYYVARFDPMKKVLDDLILHIPGYNYGITQNDSNQLEFKLIPWTNRWQNGTSGGVEFSVRLRNLIAYDYTYERPDYTFVLVGGGRDTNQGDAPIYRQFAYSGNEFARARWGNWVQFVDKRGTTDVNELKQAAWDALKLEDGKADAEKNMIAKINCTATITEVEGGPQLGVDWDLGDYVRVVIHEGESDDELIEVLDYINEITITLTDQSGEEISATVGSTNYISNKWPFPYLTDRFTRIEERLTNLEGGY